MILIAGISTKVRTLEETPRLCPACGLARAYLKRVDHYVNLFFIPLFRVKQGEPVLMCERCGTNPVDTGTTVYKRPESPRSCRYCGRPLEQDFIYCPHCGKRHG